MSDRLLLNEVAQFIGEDNKEKLQNGITSLILNEIRKDLENYDFYLLDP